MEEWIKKIDALRVRVERLAKLSVKEKGFDSMAGHHLFSAAYALDRALTAIELKAAREARPSARKKRRK